MTNHYKICLFLFFISKFWDLLLQKDYTFNEGVGLRVQIITDKSRILSDILSEQQIRGFLHLSAFIDKSEITEIKSLVEMQFL